MACTALGSSSCRLKYPSDASYEIISCHSHCHGQIQPAHLEIAVASFGEVGGAKTYDVLVDSPGALIALNSEVRVLRVVEQPSKDLLVSDSRKEVDSGTDEALLASKSLSSPRLLLDFSVCHSAMMMLAESVMDDQDTDEEVYFRPRC